MVKHMWRGTVIGMIPCTAAAHPITRLSSTRKHHQGPPDKELAAPWQAVMKAHRPRLALTSDDPLLIGEGVLDATD